jgi:hypothetical protein
MTMKKDKLLKTMVETQHLLKDYKTPPRKHSVRETDSNGVAFVQNRLPTRPPIGTIKCWHCGIKVHYKSDCPELQVKELDASVQNLNINIFEEAHSLFSANKGWVMMCMCVFLSSGYR